MYEALKDFIYRVLHNKLYLYEILKGENIMTNTNINSHAREELINVIKAMSDEELEIVVDYIPVELCLKKIDKELTKAKEVQMIVAHAFEAAR